jgi:KDO2-lipid IV(A) lauroyltransferase
LSAVLQAVPSSLVGGLATISGLTMSELWRARRPVIRANLRRVVGPGLSDAALERLVTEAFDSYARYWVESARLASMGPAEVFRRFSIEGFERVEEESAKHRGIILALPHFGLWDLGGVWLTLKGYPMTTVAETLEPPDLFDWFRSQRESLGLTIHTFGSDTSGRLASALRAGRLVGLVADRDLVGNGVEVEFFGERTTLPGGPAVLALRTGAPLFPSIVYQVPGGKGHGVILPPLETERTGSLRADVGRVTQELAHSFEGLIRKAPEQWHMFQANWPADRERYG